MTRPSHFRAYDPAGTVLAQLDLPAFGAVRFVADEMPVGYVVFYEGGQAAESVVGRTDFEQPRSGVVWIDWDGDA